MDQQAESSRLSSRKRKELKGRAHSLDPVARVGKDGLTEAVLQEIRRDLDDHELIKVWVGGQDRGERLETASIISRETGAELVQSIGRMQIFFRAGQPELTAVAGSLNAGDQGIAT